MIIYDADRASAIPLLYGYRYKLFCGQKINDALFGYLWRIEKVFFQDTKIKK